MAKKYDYDKNILKGLGVKPFMNEVKVRERHIGEAPADEIRTAYNENALAAFLHPPKLDLVVSGIQSAPNAKIYTLKDPDGKPLPFFRAGQYISVCFADGEGNLYSRPYTLLSSPLDALERREYRILVKRVKDGVVSPAVLDGLKDGAKLIASAPLGTFHYQPLRDASHVVAAAGGSGITPFVSMAKAIAEGSEDFNLTVIYGSRTKDEVLLKDELDSIQNASKGRVKVVHVLSDELVEGFEHGFIDASLIRKHASGDFSLFVCGPAAMYAHMKKEAAALSLPARRVRFEVPGELYDPAGNPGYPEGCKGGVFKAIVHFRGETREIECRAEESLLRACERQGIKVTSDCRSGVCGWCRSRLAAGKVYVRDDADGRREADRKFGWIHPCATYPLGDVEMEVFPL